MPARRSRIHVGTSGWSYDDWAGRFYPKGLDRSGWLEHYAGVFDTVELNASFYRLPFEGMVKSWNRRLPRGFHFVAKGSRLITHRKRLEDVAENVERFLDRMGKIETLRVVLWQLPPALKLDLPRLERFLGLLPDTVTHAVEFRHASWWCDEARDLLARHGAAFVAVSHPTLPGDIVPTGKVLYLRFHGTGESLYAHDYKDPELRAWAERARPLLRGRTLYAFFNNDYHAYAPTNALHFRSLL